MYKLLVILIILLFMPSNFYAKDLEIRRYYTNGNIHEKYTAIIDGMDTIENGKHTNYYPNGNLKGISYFKNGEFEGSVTAWHENGKKAIYGKWHNKKIDGDWYLWGSSGKIIVHETIKDDKLIKNEQHISNLAVLDMLDIFEIDMAWATFPFCPLLYDK